MMENLLKHRLAPFSLAALLLPAGCHSAFVQATVVNNTGSPIRLFEVDYPSASFGSGDLAPGAKFQYRFKILGSGPSKLIWTDAAQHDHTAAGPQMHEGEEGSLTIAIEPSTAIWASQLQKQP